MSPEVTWQLQVGSGPSAKSLLCSVHYHDMRLKIQTSSENVIFDNSRVYFCLDFREHPASLDIFTFATSGLSSISFYTFLKKNIFLPWTNSVLSFAHSKLCTRFCSLELRSQLKENEYCIEIVSNKDLCNRYVFSVILLSNIVVFWSGLCLYPNVVRVAHNCQLFILLALNLHSTFLNLWQCNDPKCRHPRELSIHL